MNDRPPRPLFTPAECRRLGPAREVAGLMTDCPTPQKLAFRSAAAARRWWIRARFRDGKDRLHPYLCPCGRWHLTHQAPAQQREIAARIARKVNA